MRKRGAHAPSRVVPGAPAGDSLAVGSTSLSPKPQLHGHSGPFAAALPEIAIEGDYVPQSCTLHFHQNPPTSHTSTYETSAAIS